MKGRNRPAVVLIAAVGLGGGLGKLAGQSTGNTGYVFELPAGARALSMGNTLMLAESDPAALFYNPSLVTRGGGTGLSVQRYGSTGTLGAFSAVTEWAGGSLALGIQALQYGSSSLDPADLSSNEGQLLFQGSNGASELAGTVAYGRTWLGLRVGVAAKVYEQRIREAAGGVLAADIGAAKDLGPFTMGLAAQHLGPNMTLHGMDRPLPARVTLGASLRRRPVGPFDVGAAASVARRRDGEVVPAGGVEVSYWPVSGRTFTVRVGARRRPNPLGITSPVIRPFTFGAGFTGDRITIDYAFQGFNGGAGGAHRIGFRWR